MQTILGIFPNHDIAVALRERKCSNRLKLQLVVNGLVCLGSNVHREYLLHELAENSLSERRIDLAEGYLCSVLKGKHTQLIRFDQYCKHELIKEGITVSLLPPSTFCTTRSESIWLE